MLADPRGRRRPPHDAEPPALEQASAALAAGKHVVCEKPLAMDSAETAELLRLAEQSGLVHAVNFNIRFYPQCQEARGARAAGEIGDVRLISGGYLQDWLLLDTDWNWRLDPRRGRRAARRRRHRLALARPRPVHHRPPRRGRDGRPHDVHPRAQAADRPGRDVQRRRPAARPSTRRWRPRTPPAILLRLSGGARAVVTVSQVSAGPQEPPALGDRRLRRPRSRGTPRRPEELWIGHRDRPNELLLREAAATYPPGHAEGFPDTFKRPLPRRLPRGGGRRAAATNPTTRRSPTATTRP